MTSVTDWLVAAADDLPAIDAATLGARPLLVEVDLHAPPLARNLLHDHPDASVIVDFGGDRPAAIIPALEHVLAGFRPRYVVGRDWAPTGDPSETLERWRSVRAALAESTSLAGSIWAGLLPSTLAGWSQIDPRILDEAELVLLDLGFRGAGRAAAVRRMTRLVASVPRTVPVAGLWCPSGVAPEMLEAATCRRILGISGAGLAAPPAVWHQLEEEPAPTGGDLPARVTVVWSSTNRRAVGDEWGHLLADAPFAGMVTALDRAHVPLRLVDIERLEPHLAATDLLVLPGVAALSDLDADRIRSFVAAGGALLATGDAGRWDEHGRPRPVGALADVLGVTADPPEDPFAPITWRVGHGYAPGPNLGYLKGPATEHSYLRLQPELARITDGPHVDREPEVRGLRHPILAGFGTTDLLAFGGIVAPMTVAADRDVVATVVPGFPSMPIEKVIPDPERTAIPGVVVGAYRSGRVAYLPADLDRRVGLDPLPDLLDLLAATARWLLGASSPAIRTAGNVASSLRVTARGPELELLNLSGFDACAGQRRDLPPNPGARIDRRALGEFAGIPTVDGVLEVPSFQHIIVDLTSWGTS